MSKIKKIHMVILMQSDLETAIEFYQKLGLTLKFHLRNAWAEMLLNDIKIGLCPGEAKERRTGVVFEVDNVQQFYQDNKNIITFLQEPVERVHGIMLSAKDPAGNIIDFYQPTPEKVKDLVKKAHGEQTDAEG